MYQRHTTPPSAIYSYLQESSSAQISPDGSLYSHNASPNSVATSITTPPRSPVRHYGAILLPKMRSQDQTTEPASGPVRKHSRAVSTSHVPYPTGGNYSSYSSRMSMGRRAPSPGTQSDLLSPASTQSFETSCHSALNSPISFSAPRAALPHSRSHSASGVSGGSHHRRSSSGSSIDESVIGRYGYPTYRQMPSYVTNNAPATSGISPPSLNLVTALPSTYNSSSSSSQQFSQLTTESPFSQDFQYLDFSPAPAVQHPLASEFQYDDFDFVQTTTLLDYLTAPNPSPALVRRITGVTRGVHTHFWWDVRNLRSWTEFNMATINTIPALLPLLQIPVAQSSLPAPARPNLQPDCESALQDLCRDFYVSKVNAALRVAQGDAHMMMRACKSAPGSRQQPDFISNYQSDYEKTIYGDGRGRVVGLVKAYDQWNTGMRSEAPNKQVYYLQGLAHLHRVMREHGCRYGFIITEIELLCVRCGGPPDAAVVDPTTVNSTSGVPIFGYLELSASIPLHTYGMDPETGAPRMTAGLALWFLHMLAKEKPLPGMGGWRMDVGGPAALTRQNCLGRDNWIPKPNLSEKREAKRLRGWIFPEEPLSRKECGRGKRKNKD